MLGTLPDRGNYGSKPMADAVHGSHQLANFILVRDAQPDREIALRETRPDPIQFQVGGTVLGQTLFRLQAVKVTVYLADWGDFAAMNEVYQQFVSPPYPARSTVPAKIGNSLIAVDCIAVVPEE